MTGRARWTLATALMTAIVVLLAPIAAQAADSPEGAVDEVLDAVEEQRLDDLDWLVCEEQQAVIRDRFDVAASLPEAVDFEAAAGAVDIIITDRTVELVEQTGERAEVHVGGRLSALVDAALVRELAELSLGTLGVDVDPGHIDDLANQLTEQLEAGSPIADDVTVAWEGSTWLVCDDIVVGADAARQGDATEGMCAFMTVAELNTIDEERGGAGFDSYTRSTWDGESGLCTYDTGEGGIGSVQLGRSDFPFEDIAGVRPGGTDEMVAGRRAYLKDNDLFVELEDGYLYVNAPAKGTPDGGIDYLDMPAGVAALVLSRIDG